MSALACPVRGCGALLTREGPALTCPQRHSFDVARSGYVNLLQPQDRRSPKAGDSRDAVEARSRLLAAGIGRAALDAVVTRAAALDLPSRPVVVDLGCGGGELLGALSSRRAIDGIGIDLSASAVEAAARRFPTLTWVVANADRHLPLADRSAALVVSLNGRRNPDETRRVLLDTGYLLIALPAPDDLIELRAAVQGEGIARGRAQAVIAAHAGAFELCDHWQCRETRTLTAEQARDALAGTYRGRRANQAARAATLGQIEVTLSADLLLFTKR